MDINFHFYFHNLNLEEELKEIKSLLNRIIEQGEIMAGEVAKLEQDVADQTTVIQSAITLLNNIGQLLRDAGTDPVKLLALSTAIESNSTALAAAVAANTPGAPTGGDPNA